MSGIGCVIRVVSLSRLWPIGLVKSNVQQVLNSGDTPGTMNPADVPKRGLSATELAESKPWMEEPAFLKDDESTWPCNDQDTYHQEQCKYSH